MPNANEFLLGFGFTRGLKLAGYTLINATSTHETIKRYNEYRYDIILLFQNNDHRMGASSLQQYDDFSDEIMNIISEEHIIYGIRNPYLCKIDLPIEGDIFQDEYGDITLYLTGHSYRVYDKD